MTPQKKVRKSRKREPAGNPHDLEIGRSVHSTMEILLDVASDPDWLALMRAGGDPRRAAELADEYRQRRNESAPDALREKADAAIQMASSTLQQQKIRLTQGSVMKVVVKLSAHEELVIAAMIWLTATQLLEALPLEDGELPSGAPSWRTVELAHELGHWTGVAAHHDDIHRRRGTARATEGKVRLVKARREATDQAIRAGQVKPDARAVAKWQSVKYPSSSPRAAPLKHSAIWTQLARDAKNQRRNRVVQPAHIARLVSLQAQIARTVREHRGLGDACRPHPYLHSCPRQFRTRFNRRFQVKASILRLPSLIQLTGLSRRTFTT